MKPLRQYSNSMKSSVGCALLMALLGIALSPAAARAFAYIADSSASSVSVIDTATSTIVGAPIPVGNGPWGVAITPDGAHVYVTNNDDHNVSVIDTTSNTAVATIQDLRNPAALAITPDGANVYVSSSCDNAVSVISTATNTAVGAPITVGYSSCFVDPFAVAITPDGAHVYVANYSDDTVSVIATATNTVVGNPIPVGLGPWGVAITPDGAHVYVTNSDDNTVSVIDTTTNMVVGTPIPVGIQPLGIISSLDGAYVYVTNGTDGTVSVINTTTNRVGSVISLGSGSNPRGMALIPDGTYLYVTDLGLGSVDVIATATDTVVATIHGLIDPEGIAIAPGSLDPPPPPPPVPFVPPTNGFDWSTEQRFGASNGSPLFHIVDFHWNSASMQYDSTYVHPTSLTVHFSGCPSLAEQFASASESTYNTYTWQMDGNTFGPQHSCVFSHPFSLPPDTNSVSTPVTLTITTPNSVSTSFTNQVKVRDILIVSIGDSYASGEGNPDYPLQWDGATQVSPPFWEDTRCHRSAWSGPAQAALALAQADPHTSVTFLSFACSGATVGTPSWDSSPDFDSLLHLPITPFALLTPDPNKPQGVGILEAYRGAEPPYPNDYNPNDFIPRQMDQLRAAIGPRPIDALIMSGGGNDMRFSDIAEVCLLTSQCWDHGFLYEGPYGPGFLSLENIVDRVLLGGSFLGSLPHWYNQLAAEIAQLTFTNKTPNVYITEYPDPTRNDAGAYCDQVLEDVLSPHHLDQSEVSWAGGLGQRLNQAVADAATGYGWHYVSGIASEFIRDSVSGSGHGYCASDPWVVRATLAARNQGPCYPIAIRVEPYLPPFYVLYCPQALTKGLLHPNIEGHQVYAKALLKALLPTLSPGVSPPALTFNFNPPSPGGGLTPQPGNNGWFVGTCGQACDATHVVQTITATTAAPALARASVAGTSPAGQAVTASAPTVIVGASVAVNGTPGCSVPGVTCTTQQSTTKVEWNFDFTADGIYRVNTTAEVGHQQSASLVHEVKVDLHPPMLRAATQPTTLWPPNGNMVPVTVSGIIGDAVSGVDASTATYAVADEYGTVQPSGPITLNEDGSYSFTIQLQASRNGNDMDGRHYTITVSAQNSAGNKGSAAAGVTVPHDQGH